MDKQRAKQPGAAVGSVCVCVAGGRGPALDLGSCNISISGSADDIFIFLFTAAEIKLDKRPGESQAVCSLGGKYGNALNVHPGRSESGTRKQHNWSASCESRH